MGNIVTWLRYMTGFGLVNEMLEAETGSEENKDQCFQDDSKISKQSEDNGIELNFKSEWESTRNEEAREKDKPPEHNSNINESSSILIQAVEEKTKTVHFCITAKASADVEEAMEMCKEIEMDGVMWGIGSINTLEENRNKIELECSLKDGIEEELILKEIEKLTEFVEHVCIIDLINITMKSDDIIQSKEEHLKDISDDPVHKQPKFNLGVEKVEFPENESNFLIELSGLPWKATEKEIADFLVDCNIVGNVLIIKNEQGRPSGDARVKLKGISDIENALKCNRKYLHGRFIVIEEIESDTKTRLILEREESKTQENVYCKLSGLVWSATEEDINTFLAACKVIEVVITTNERGKPSGDAYVHLESKNDAQKAKACNKKKLRERFVVVVEINEAQFFKETEGHRKVTKSKKDDIYCLDKMITTESPILIATKNENMKTIKFWVTPMPTVDKEDVMEECKDLMIDGVFWGLGTIKKLLNNRLVIELECSVRFDKDEENIRSELTTLTDYVEHVEIMKEPTSNKQKVLDKIGERKINLYVTPKTEEDEEDVLEECKDIMIDGVSWGQGKITHLANGKCVIELECIVKDGKETDVIIKEIEKLTNFVEHVEMMNKHESNEQIVLDETGERKIHLCVTPKPKMDEEDVLEECKDIMVEGVSWGNGNIILVNGKSVIELECNVKGGEKTDIIIKEIEKLSDFVEDVVLMKNQPVVCQKHLVKVEKTGTLKFFVKPKLMVDEEDVMEECKEIDIAGVTWGLGIINYSASEIELECYISGDINVEVVKKEIQKLTNLVNHVEIFDEEKHNKPFPFNKSWGIKDFGHQAENFKQHLEIAGKTGSFCFTDKGLDKFPSDLVDAVSLWLRALDLSGNMITIVPSSVGDFKQLKKISLAKNKIEFIPEEFGNLTNLQNLNLSFNLIQSVPSSLHQLEKLKEIFLSNNNLNTFPLPLLKLKQLTKVDLSSNHLTSIPREVEELEAEELVLSGNKIDTLSTEISRCPKLKTLRLNDNCLTLDSIPTALLANSKVSLLTLERNQIEEKKLRKVEGFNKYMERYTAVKKKMDFVGSSMSFNQACHTPENVLLSSKAMF